MDARVSLAEKTDAKTKNGRKVKSVVAFLMSARQTNVNGDHIPVTFAVVQITTLIIIVALSADVDGSSPAWCKPLFESGLGTGKFPESLQDGEKKWHGALSC